MRRASPFARFLLPTLGLLAVLAWGCGKARDDQSTLSFEQLPDTAGLTQGRPIVTALETDRIDGGALLVKGGADLPDGTRLQIAIKRPGERSTVAMAHVEVQDHHFESPPLVGEFGPLAPARYLIEVSGRFTPDQQSPAVLRATGDGKALRGPGITRDRNGDAMFFLSQETQR